MTEKTRPADTALQFGLDCGYLDTTTHSRLAAMNGSIGRMLGTMLREPGLFVSK